VAPWTSTEALRTTGSIRDFSPEPVPDQLLYDVLDRRAICALGWNRQAWRVIAVTVRRRRELHDIYLDAGTTTGARLSWSSPLLASRPANAERASAAAQKREEAIALSQFPRDSAETIDTVPVMLVVLADLGALAATDRDLERYSIVGGAIGLSLRLEHIVERSRARVWRVMTTVLTRHEDQGAPRATGSDTFGG